MESYLGTTWKLSFQVTRKHTSYLPGDSKILATPFLIYYLEGACNFMIRVGSKKQSVGTSTNLDYLDIGSIDDTVECRAKLVKIDEEYHFQIEAVNEKTGKILAKGFHKRRIMERSRL